MMRAHDERETAMWDEQFSSGGERALFWSARVLSGLILAFWAFFIVAHWFGDQGVASRPLTFSDYAGIVAMLTSLAGLAIAFQREKLGATIALMGITIGTLLNGHLVLSPYLVIPLAASLFLIHAFLGSCTKCSRKHLHTRVGAR